VEIEEEPAPARALAAAERRVCPRCRAGNPPEYPFCAVCGEKLPAPAEAPPIQAPEQTRCPRCHWDNPPGRLFCEGCGLDLRLKLEEIHGRAWSPPAHATGPRDRLRHPTPSQTSGTSKWGACWGCLVMALIAFFFMFLSWVGSKH